MPWNATAAKMMARIPNIALLAALLMVVGCTGDLTGRSTADDRLTTATITGMDRTDYSASDLPERVRLHATAHEEFERAVFALKENSGEPTWWDAATRTWTAEEHENTIAVSEQRLMRDQKHALTSDIDFSTIPFSTDKQYILSFTAEDYHETGYDEVHFGVFADYAVTEDDTCCEALRSQEFEDILTELEETKQYIEQQFAQMRTVPVAPAGVACTVVASNNCRAACAAQAKACTFKYYTHEAVGDRPLTQGEQGFFACDQTPTDDEREEGGIAADAIGNCLCC